MVSLVDFRDITGINFNIEQCSAISNAQCCQQYC